MRKKNSKTEALIRANQQKASKLLKMISIKSSTRAKLLQEIRALGSSLSKLKESNQKLGGYSATLGMRPKQKSLENVVKRVLRPGKEITVAQIEAAVLATGYQTKQTAWFRAPIGKAMRSIEGVHMVAGKKGTYIYNPHKKTSSPSPQAAA